MSADLAAEPDVNPLEAGFWTSLLSNLLVTAQAVALRLVYALIILLIGWIIIKIILWLVGKALNARPNLDPTLKGFCLSVLKGILWLLLITAVIDAIDLELLSVGAIIAAMGLAIGFAVGGIMSNFVAGILLLARKPFKVGDYIEAQGVQGVVKLIDMFMTTIHTIDNKVVTVPNLPLASETVINYTGAKKRRVDLVIGVAYDADLVQTRKVLAKVAKKHNKVLNDPPCQIAVSNLGDSSVDFVMRPWCNKEDYWTVYWDMHAQVKVALDNAGIGIPYPNMDIHIIDDDAAPAARAAVESSEEEYSYEETEEPVVKGSKKSKKGVFGALKSVKKGATDTVKSTSKSVKKGTNDVVKSVKKSKKK